MDIARQQPNVLRMKLLGAEVRPVESGSRTLKDAINEAIRDWVTNVRDTHYLLGSALGPHPYPTIVRDFQSVIGSEARAQILAQAGRLPDACVACVGGGSNAIGLFHAFRDDRRRAPDRRGGGRRGHRHRPPRGALRRPARWAGPACCTARYTYVLQDADGQIAATHSISAGLDYRRRRAGARPSARHRPRRVHLAPTTRRRWRPSRLLARTEGHPAGAGIGARHRRSHPPGPDPAPDGQIVLVNLSGRGDKDLDTVTAALRVRGLA